MEKGKKFMKEHGKTIKMALRNSKLSTDKLQRRLGLMRKSLKNNEDKVLLDSIERKMKGIIDRTGKDQFSEDDIEIIMCQVLGIDIREYDKSHLVDLDKGEIRSIDKIVKDIKLTPYEFGDTKITHLGDVVYSEWRAKNKGTSRLSCYKIDKQDEYGKTYEYEVFSSIDIGRMEEDPDYREAVLDVLLEENNMLKTNCGGYIGKIRPINEGKSSEDTVKANSRYSLIFDSTDATVMMMLRNIVKERQEKEKQEKQGEER